jgi:predicted enzyme related to lactoylglutathione lyase
MSESKPGSVVWIDLSVPDAQSVRRFYSEVVGWRSEPVGMGGYEDYSMLPAGAGDPVAGICHARGVNAKLPAQWLIYVTVGDLAASVRRCQELGGRVIDGPRSMGEQKVCVIQDPAGAVVGLVGR